MARSAPPPWRDSEISTPVSRSRWRVPESRRSSRQATRWAGIAHGCNDLQPGTAGAKTTRGMANTRMASRWKSAPLLIVLTLSVPPALAAAPTTDPSHACCTKVSPHHTEMSAPACCRIPEAIPGAPAAPVPKLATHARLVIAAIPCETPWAAGAHQPLVPVPPGKHTGYALAPLNTVLRC